jgi:hypothetical protein
MPTQYNINNNVPGVNPIRVGIDPAFKGDQKITTPINTESNAFNILSNQKYTPSGTPAPDVLSGIKRDPGAPKSMVRTFKSDIESVIQRDHLSSVNIALAESGRARSQMIAEPSPSKSNFSKSKIIIFISLLLIIGGVGAMGTIYFINRPSSGPVAQFLNIPSLITTEGKTEFDISSVSKSNIVSLLANKLSNSQLKTGNFNNAYLTTNLSTGKKLVNSTEFVSLMNFSMPEMIKRTLLPEFMVGTYYSGKNLPFVIFKTSYFENTYAGMLEWEKDMELDFRNLFKLSGYDSAEGILERLTSSAKFEDASISNKDVRVLRDDSGKIMFLYGIINRDTIIITVSDTAFSEIIDRLNNEKSLKR